jgi:XTP/dITP diphosphohydrolase
VAPPYFVEDAGLLVETLRGFPGVYSAQAFRTIGNEGLLRLLSDARDRSASFRAVVAYVDGPRPPRMFTGDIHGRIARTPRGHNGFGFDPIFVPEGHRRTFAQMGPEEKNRLSHRARALDRLARHLRRAR